jgi:hypothetical protein
MRVRAAAVWAVVAVGAWLSVGAARAQEPEPGPTADAFFNDGVVHDVRLTINPKDWSILRANFRTNTYYPCHFTWQGTTVRNIGIRSRGTGSRSGEKPGLRVDFDYYTNKQRFLGLKSFVLRNNIQDSSMLHERIAMKLFLKMGLPAPREAHARLFVNDEYAGLYTIVEAVDKVFLERHFQENDGFLYEYDYDPEDPPYYFDYRGEDPALYSPKPFKPATHEKDPDAKPIEAMIRIINQTPNSRFREEIAEYLDLTRFMTYVAIENFVAETDGFLGNWAMNNFYLYRFEKKNLSILVPWDKSHAFTVGPEHNIWHNVDVPSSLRNRLMERAMEFPDLAGVYLDTLVKAAEVASTPPVETSPTPPTANDPPPAPKAGWLEAEIQRQYQQIRDFALVDTLKPQTNGEFEAAIQFLLFFARERPDVVRREIERIRGQK